MYGMESYEPQQPILVRDQYGCPVGLAVPVDNPYYPAPVHQKDDYSVLFEQFTRIAMLAYEGKSEETIQAFDAIAQRVKLDKNKQINKLFFLLKSSGLYTHVNNLITYDENNSHKAQLQARFGLLLSYSSPHGSDEFWQGNALLFEAVKSGCLDPHEKKVCRDRKKICQMVLHPGQQKRKNRSKKVKKSTEAGTATRKNVFLSRDEVMQSSDVQQKQDGTDELKAQASQPYVDPQAIDEIFKENPEQTKENISVSNNKKKKKKANPPTIEELLEQIKKKEQKCASKNNKRLPMGISFAARKKAEMECKKNNTM